MRGHSNELRSILPTHTATRTVLNVHYVFMQAGPGVLMPSFYHCCRVFNMDAECSIWMAKNKATWAQTSEI